MATEIVMPRLGWTMEEGVLVEWLKRDGDQVNAGEILFTVESDKALNEVESFESGILRIPPDSPPPGEKVLVGGLLAYLVQPGEAAPFEGQAKSIAAPAIPVGAQHAAPTLSSAPSNDSGANGGASQPVQTTPKTSEGEVKISPRARRVAGELGVDWLTIKGSGRTGRIVERDVRAAAAVGAQHAAPTSAAEVRASPLARRMAEELNVDLEKLAAEQPGKRIERADVERAASSASPTAPVGAQAVTPVSPAAPAQQPAARSPMTRTRKVIAERMAASAHTTAPVTLTTEVDATELVRLRKQLKGDSQAAARPVPSYTDLLAKLGCAALLEHPGMNVRLDGNDIVPSEAVHIGLAVDTDRGLLVPVIRDVQGKSLRQISQDSAALAERARTGASKPDDMGGSTFTITNLGMYDIDAFTPIINLPDCAILGVGRIVAKQVVVDAEAERVAIRHMLFLSLTFDHRLVDGAPAARFLQRIKQFVEQPYLWLTN